MVMIVGHLGELGVDRGTTAKVLLELDFFTFLSEEVLTRREQALAAAAQPAKAGAALFEGQLAEGPRIETGLRSGCIPPRQGLGTCLLRRFLQLRCHRFQQVRREGNGRSNFPIR